MQPIAGCDPADADMPATQNLLPDQRDHNGMINVVVGGIAVGNVLQR